MKKRPEHSKKMKALWKDPNSKYNSEEMRIKKSKAVKGDKNPMYGKGYLILNKDNPNWKGDEVGLNALHGWIKRNKPKTKLCENCNEKPPFDCANISGKYKRDINDYEWLCRRCHMEKDERLDKLIERNKIKKQKLIITRIKKEELKNLYFNKKMSINAIAKYFGVTHKVIKLRLERWF